MSALPSSQISVTWFLRTKETLSLEDQMTSRRNPLNAAAFLIILIKVFSALSLTCHPGEYQIGNECCPKCLPGGRVKNHCNKDKSTSCLPCVDGTYTDEPNGLEQCTPCMSCDSGSGLKVKRSCTVTSDTVCEPLEGFYCISSVGDGCEEAQKHSSCKPGQYISKHGTASTDTECSDCSSGTFSDGTSPSCQPHTQCEALNLQLITAGTSAADAQCGERSDNVILAVTIAGILISIIAGVLLLYFRKKVFECKFRNTHGGNNIPECQKGKRGVDESVGMKERDERSEEIKYQASMKRETTCRKRQQPSSVC